MNEELVTLRKAAEILGVERMTAYRYAKSGKLPVTMVNGMKMVKVSDLKSVDVQPPGKPGTKREHRIWTPAMTRRRAAEWTDALKSGVVDADEDPSKVDAEKIAEWEAEHGWTVAELMKALDDLEAKRKREPFE